MEPSLLNESSKKYALQIFLIVLVILQVLRIAIGLTAFPLALVPALTIATTIVFVATPIFAVFYGAAYPWTPKVATLFIAIGVPVQLGLTLLAKTALLGFPALLAMSAAQVALFCWCVGLGALLATLLKDRNLLIPITIFLAVFDAFLIFAPVGFTRIIMEKAPQVLPSVGASIPKIQTTVTAAPVGQFATIGPADFVFMGMFFIALFRFGMETRKTLMVLVPTVLAYLVLSAFFGSIPLLPPIALTVLIVNFKLFKLTKDEWVSTAVVAALSIAGLIYGITRPQPVVVIREGQAGPSSPAPGQETPKSADSPSPTSSGQSPSPAPVVP